MTKQYDDPAAAEQRKLRQQEIQKTVIDFCHPKIPE